MERKKVVFVLGGPGAGKGTQCRNIMNHFGFIHISAGELLRQERQIANSQHGELIESCIREGRIVPAEITCKLLEKEMNRFPNDKFLIDGFPRNKENMDGWDKILGDKVDVLFVLYFDCPVEICIQRCMDRGAAAGSGRFDDNLEVLQKRINTHLMETQPTIDHYRGLDLLETIDGSKGEVEVFEDVKKIFASLIKI